MSDGVIVELGPPAAVLERPDNRAPATSSPLPPLARRRGLAGPQCGNEGPHGYGEPGARSLHDQEPPKGERRCCATRRDREDRSFDLLTDAILQRDQPRTADLFIAW